MQAGGQRFDPANLHQRRKPRAPFESRFKWERRQNEVSELWTERVKRDGRSEGNGVSADDGPIAQLARAHD